MNEAIVLHSALSFLSTVGAQSDPRVCRSVGLRPDQVAWLQNVRASALSNLASQCAGCVRIEIDAEAFDDLITDVDEKTRRDELIRDFILHDASRSMMTFLFEMSQRDFARARSFYNVEMTTGRPRELTPDEANAVFDVWQANGGDTDPKTLLAVAQKLDVPLRLIWDELTKNYLADDGGLSWA